MKKTKSESDDWGRPEYKRSDLGELVRGKYANRIKESSKVVLLDPDVAEAFPNDEAVNNALRSLIPAKRKPRRVMLKRKTRNSSGTKKPQV